MEVSKVTEEDGRSAAYLMQFLAVASKLVDALRIGGFPLSGPGVDYKDSSFRWLLGVSESMAKQISASKAGVLPTTTASSTTGIRVKSSGKLPSPTTGRKGSSKRPSNAPKSSGSRKTRNRK